MRLRSISALYAVIIAASGAVFLSGCASGHKQFAYVVGQGTNEVFTFREQANGALTPLGAPNFPAGSAPIAMTPHTSGAFLYVVNFAGNNVTLLDINQSNGELSTPVTNSVVTPVNPPNIFVTGAGPVAIAMSPTAPFLYIANQSAGTISGYNVDPSVGTLGNLKGTPFPVTSPAVSNPSALVISPDGKFLFIANGAQGTIAAFGIGSDGGLTAIGTPVALSTGATPTSLALEHSGRFLYAADPAHNAIFGFAIQGNGSLSPITGSPFAAGTQPGAVAADPQGAFLFAANAGSNNVSAYVIDASSGALGQVTGSPFATGGQGPTGLAVDANTTVLYVTEATTHDIAALAILSNGALKPIAGSPFTVATSASSITLVRR
jgi:6-phosphogluconolactonase (cycloisomerase 2 family)